MTEVLLDHVSKVYDDGTLAVSAVDLSIRSGELMVFVGPSGCGKSSILRMIAGLEEVSGGTVMIGGERVNDVSPARRNIAMVFQNYALYPHMTVRKNMGFSLRLQHLAKSLRKSRVEDTATVLGLTDLLDRHPAQLSGGQRQRVAMGRAIVRDPRVFLLDEPLSNLDAKLRTQMRSEIRELQRRLDATMIFVTHDQVEAMTMADRIVILRRGVLQQVGTPWELYHRPANLFVADFIGSPSMNLLRGTIGRVDDRITLDYGQGPTLAIPESAVGSADLPQDAHREIILGVRPEHLAIGSPDPELGGLHGTVRFTEMLGDETLIHVDVPTPPVITDELRDIAADIDQTMLKGLETASESRFVVKSTGIVEAGPGDNVLLTVQPDKPVYMFDPEEESTPAWPTRSRPEDT